MKSRAYETFYDPITSGNGGQLIKIMPEWSQQTVSSVFHANYMFGMFRLGMPRFWISVSQIEAP